MEPRYFKTFDDHFHSCRSEVVSSSAEQLCHSGEKTAKSEASLVICAIVSFTFFHRHVYIFLFIIGVVTFAGTEEGPVVFMFYKRQYKINSETFAWLGSAWGLCAFFSQLLLVPFLSMTLGIKDTTIMIMAFVSCSASLLLEVAMTEVWALFFSWTALQLLWSNMDKAAVSAISKLVGAQEIGKILCLVWIMYHGSWIMDHGSCVMDHGFQHQDK